jgi:hypothetical protein
MSGVAKGNAVMAQSIAKANVAPKKKKKVLTIQTTPAPVPSKKAAPKKKSVKKPHGK